MTGRSYSPYAHLPFGDERCGWEPDDGSAVEGSVAYFTFLDLPLERFRFRVPVFPNLRRSPSLFRRRLKPDLAQLLFERHWPIEERRMHRQRILVHRRRGQRAKAIPNSWDEL